MDDLALVKDLLDSEVVVEALGFPFNVTAAVHSLRDLRSLAAGNDAAAVCVAWSQLSGAVGPKLMAAMLSCPDWERLCPLRYPLDEYGASDHEREVWLSDKHKVVARARMDGTTFLGLAFAVESR